MEKQKHEDMSKVKIEKKERYKPIRKEELIDFQLKHDTIILEMNERRKEERLASYDNQFDPRPL
jgi:hypothetical protein